MTLRRRRKNTAFLRQVRHVSAACATHKGVLFGALGAAFGAALGAYAVVVGVNFFVTAVTIHSSTSAYIFAKTATFLTLVLLFAARYARIYQKEQI